MKRLFILFGVIVLNCLLITSGSEISPLSVDQLTKASKVIVIGQVFSIATNDSGFQDVSVKVTNVLKGRTSDKQFIMELQMVGVKDFDPELRPGDMAVFFLKSLRHGRAEKAYHGSIAVFTKPNFSSDMRP